MEEIPQGYVSNPLVTWGIIISTLGALQDHFIEAPDRLNFRRVNIGVNFPYEERTPTAIIVGLSNLEVQNSGFYSAELTEPRNQVLISKGEITIEIWTPNHNNLMTMVDYITQGYLLNMFDKKKMRYPGADRSYIAIEYGGGKLNWGDFGFTSPPHTQGSDQRLHTASTSFKFFAEHHISTDLARVTAVEIEAIPLNVVV